MILYKQICDFIWIYTINFKTLVLVGGIFWQQRLLLQICFVFIVQRRSKKKIKEKRSDIYTQGKW